MPAFGTSSRRRLSECDERIQTVMNEVVREFDCSILEGHRNEERQNEMFRTGKSHLKWPQGKHNTDPSQAVDVAPYPINWNDRERFTLFAGYVLGIASTFGIKLRWGGDWNGDWQVRDNNFDDLPHFEIIEEQEKK